MRIVRFGAPPWQNIFLRHCCGRVRGTLGPPPSRSHVLINRRPVRLHAVRCQCSCTGLNMRLIHIGWWLRLLVHLRGFFIVVWLLHIGDCDLLHFLEDVCNGWENVFMLDLAPESFNFFTELTVVSSELRFLMDFALGDIWHKGRSFLKAPLNPLTSSRQVVLTMIDFGSNVDRCNQLVILLWTMPHMPYQH